MQLCSQSMDLRVIDGDDVTQHLAIPATQRHTKALYQLDDAVLSKIIISRCKLNIPASIVTIIT